MDSGPRISRFVALASVAVVLVAVCMSATAAMPHTSATGSIAAPATRLVDLQGAPTAARVTPATMAKLAGWWVSVACAALLLGRAALGMREAAVYCPSVGLRSSPLRT